MNEKMQLYFDEGAREVWLCDRTGAMTFFAPGGKRISASALCPEFPKVVELPS